MGEDEEVANYNVKVFIQKPLLDKIEIITSEYKNELGGLIFGSIKESSIVIDDIIFPKQTVSSTSVDMDKKDLLELRKQNTDKWNNLIGFWHSHNTMGSFWSGGDENEHIRIMGNSRDFSVFVVSSHNGGYSHKVRLEINKPFKISLDNLPLCSIDTTRDSIKDAVMKEINEIVIPEKTVVTTGYCYNNNKNTSKIEFLYQNSKGILIVRNLNYSEFGKVMDKFDNIVESGNEDESWWVKLNAGNKNIGYSLKDKIQELLETEKNANLSKYGGGWNGYNYWYGY